MLDGSFDDLNEEYRDLSRGNILSKTSTLKYDAEIEKLHPLKNEPFTKIFPALGKYCCCYCITSRKKDSISHKIKNLKKVKSMSFGDELKLGDPFLQLGVGLFSLRQFMRTMVLLFGILTLISIPITLTYLDGQGY